MLSYRQIVIAVTMAGAITPAFGESIKLTAGTKNDVCRAALKALESPSFKVPEDMCKLKVDDAFRNADALGFSQPEWRPSELNLLALLKSSYIQRFANRPGGVSRWHIHEDAISAAIEAGTVTVQESVFNVDGTADPDGERVVRASGMECAVPFAVSPAQVMLVVDSSDEEKADPRFFSATPMMNAFYFRRTLYFGVVQDALTEGSAILSLHRAYRQGKDFDFALLAPDCTFNITK